MEKTRKKRMKSEGTKTIGFRVLPCEKTAIWVEAAYAGVDPSTLMKEAVLVKIAQMREERERELEAV